ncbi:MAG: ThiF family adenylyltransferase [Atribacterota bacterium]|nr:ThiF family adenylyltransferase [Atribacterota bacterium]
MSWFSKHPNWLYSESLELSNNSIYKESYQFIDRTLISCGEILVHKEKTERYCILIVYPDATPYVPPSIYLLRELLSEADTKKLSQKTPNEIPSSVSDKVRFFNRRHQNEDGSLCFIEIGDLHNEIAEIFKIKDIIKRIRVWLAGRIPKDSREVELFYHFNKRCREIQYLLPDLFFDQEIVKGRFYAGLSTIMPANYSENNILKKTYVGILLTGSNNAGLQIPPKVYARENFIFYAKIPDPKKIMQYLEEKIDYQFEKDIEKGEIILGYWWDLNREPEPFSTINELAEYIGSGNEEDGLKSLVESLKIELKKLADIINIGLRFPGRWQDKDWQMLRHERGNRSILFKNDFEELKDRLLDYSISSVYQEYITEPYYHKRNMGRADRNILKSINISLIGCGALGSEISDCLCKAGIGNFLLVDKEVFNAHNSIRHCIGLNRVSFPKVFALAEYLSLHNPFVNIDVKECDILKEEFNNYFPSEFIAVSSIADDNVESFLNEKSIEYNRTVFYARALRGGKTARIFRVKPRKDACMNCLALYLKENNDLFINIEEDKDLPVITNECNNPVRPASAADLKLIASITARIIIDYLQDKGTDKNHWIWNTESLEKVNLDDSTWGVIHSRFLPPHPKCVICQGLNEKKVFICKEAYELMKEEVKSTKDLETGGVLVGHINKNGEFVIRKATLPGPKAIKKETYFLKDEEFTQKELENAFQNFGNKGLYLGEWHYHPQGKNSPSGIDIKSLTEIAKQDAYRIDSPLLIIFSPSFECALTIHDKNGQCVKLPIKVVENI